MVRRDPGRTRVILAAAGGFVLLALAKFWFVVHPDPGRRGFLAGDFGLGVEGSFYHLLKRGTVPLWDPTLGTGALFFGSGTHNPTYTIAHTHLLYPLNVLFLGLAERNQAVPILALHLQHVLHYALAGVFTFFYARALALSPAAAFAAGTIYAFSGFFTSHVSHWTMIDTATWLPLALLAGRRALEGDTRAALLGALVVGVAFLAGYPGLFLLLLAAVGLQAFWAIGWRLVDRGWHLPARPLATFGLMVVAGAGVAAIQLVPLWEPATRSHQATLDYTWKATGSLPPAALPGLLMPRVLSPLGWWASNASEFYLYPGVLTLVLAAVALWRVPSRVVGFHALLGAVALLLAFGNNLEAFWLVVDLVPGFSYFRYPARSVLLLHFALATLAGFGLDAVRRAGTTGVDLGPLLRALRIVAVVAGTAWALALAGLVVVHATPLAEPLGLVVDQLGVLLLLLGAAAALLVAARRPVGSALVAPLAIGVLVVDLLFWGGRLPMTSYNQDVVLRHPTEAARYVAQQPGIFRIGYRGAIHAQNVHANNWSVYNDESRFSPRTYVDLYSRTAKNPRLLDLLNVRYLVGMKLPPESGKYRDLSVGADSRDKRVPIDGDTPATRVELVSRLVSGATLDQGTPVAEIRLRDRDGRERVLSVRAGHETADGTIDVPGVRAGHRRATVAPAAPAKHRQPAEHDYRAEWTLPERTAPVEVELRYVAPVGLLRVQGLRLGDVDLATSGDRFRWVHPEVAENRFVLPRAFLVPRARALQTEAAVREALERLDPEREILLLRPDPADVLAGDPGARGTATITRYERHRVEVRAEVRGAPQYLLLADHYERWWRATDNGRPVRILRADLDLRAVRLDPGLHDVAFTLAFPLFHVGAAISAVSLAAIAGGLVLTRRPRERGPRDR